MGHDNRRFSKDEWESEWLMKELIRNQWVSCMVWRIYFISALWRRFFEDCDSWGPENRSNNRLRFCSWLLLLPAAQHQSWLQMMMMWVFKICCWNYSLNFLSVFCFTRTMIMNPDIGGEAKTKLSCGEASTHATCKEWEGSFCFHGTLGFRV
jgi:hypothetical protein